MSTTVTQNPFTLEDLKAVSGRSFKHLDRFVYMAKEIAAAIYSTKEAAQISHTLASDIVDFANRLDSKSTYGSSMASYLAGTLNFARESKRKTTETLKTLRNIKQFVELQRINLLSVNAELQQSEAYFHLNYIVELISLFIKWWDFQTDTHLLLEQSEEDIFNSLRDSKEIVARWMTIKEEAMSYYLIVGLLSVRSPNLEPSSPRQSFNHEFHILDMISEASGPTDWLRRLSDPDVADFVIIIFVLLIMFYYFLIVQ